MNQFILMKKHRHTHTHIHWSEWHFDLHLDELTKVIKSESISFFSYYSSRTIHTYNSIRIDQINLCSREEEKKTKEKLCIKNNINVPVTELGQLLDVFLFGIFFDRISSNIWMIICFICLSQRKEKSMKKKFSFVKVVIYVNDLDNCLHLRLLLFSICKNIKARKSTTAVVC
jgi:hypothetical protein